MNARGKNLDIPLPPRLEQTQAVSGLGIEQNNERLSELRSRLLQMILKSEHNRKGQIPAATIRRL